MEPHYQLVIFDLDGTLIDSKLDLAHSVNATRTHMGMGPLPNEQIYSYVGNGAPVLIRRALGSALPEPEVRRALEYFLEYYKEHKLDHTIVYPGVREALDELDAMKVQMAILTNKPVRITGDILEGLKVKSYFFQIYGGNSFEQKKPDPIGINTLLAQSGVARERAVMVGDSSVDVLTARNAGILSVGCTWGFQPETLETDSPDHLIEDMRELTALVRTATGSRLNATI